jgi:hypothetical protein
LTHKRLLLAFFFFLFFFFFVLFGCSQTKKQPKKASFSPSATKQKKQNKTNMSSSLVLLRKSLLLSSRKSFRGLRFASQQSTPSSTKSSRRDVATNQEQAVGEERHYLADHSATVLTGAFGTRKHPVQVTSKFDSRIVGCLGECFWVLHFFFFFSAQLANSAVCPFGRLLETHVLGFFFFFFFLFFFSLSGGPHRPHELLWHEVTGHKPTVCLECGQYFSLVKSSHDHSHH